MESGTTMEWEGLKKQGANIEGLGGIEVYVFYPFIVITTNILKGEEVVLQHDRVQPTKDNKRKAMNAFDQLKIKQSRKTASSSSI